MLLLLTKRDYQCAFGLKENYPNNEEFGFARMYPQSGSRYCLLIILSDRHINDGSRVNHNLMQPVLNKIPRVLQGVIQVLIEIPEI